MENARLNTMTHKIETVDELKDIIWSEVESHDDVCPCDYCITHAVIASITYPY